MTTDQIDALRAERDVLVERLAKGWAMLEHPDPADVMRDGWAMHDERGRVVDLTPPNLARWKGASVDVDPWDDKHAKWFDAWLGMLRAYESTCLRLSNLEKRTR